MSADLVDGFESAAKAMRAMLEAVTVMPKTGEPAAGHHRSRQHLGAASAVDHLQKECKPAGVVAEDRYRQPPRPLTYQHRTRAQSANLGPSRNCQTMVMRAL
jgi:hypothetical protein